MTDTALLYCSGVRCYSGDYAAHSHEYPQVLFGLSGCLDIDLAGRAARVDASCGLVVPAGQMHAYQATSETRVWVVDAETTRALERFRHFQLPRRWQAPQDAGRWLKQITDAPRVLQRRALDIARLQQRIMSELHEPWPIARMADEFALSVPQFHRRWKAISEQTPQQWLRTLRLARATELLREGKALDLVASHTGYGSASALCQALHRDTGHGARELRRR